MSVRYAISMYFQYTVYIRACIQKSCHSLSNCEKKGTANSIYMIFTWYFAAQKQKDESTVGIYNNDLVLAGGSCTSERRVHRGTQHVSS